MKREIRTMSLDLPLALQTELWHPGGHRTSPRSWAGPQLCPLASDGELGIMVQVYISLLMTNHAPRHASVHVLFSF